MYRLLIALMLFATMSHGLPTNATTRTATEGYVTNRVAQGLAAHATNDTAHAALFAGKVGTNDAIYTATVSRAASALQPSDTNGFTVSAHQAWITNRQNGVTLTNFTATGYFRVPDGMIHIFPGAGAFGTAYRHFGFDDSTFLFYDYSEYPDLYLYKFIIDPRDQSITYGSGLSAERWLFPTEASTNTVASKAWVSAYVSTNAGSSGGGNVESVFGRTGVVVAVSGDYTADQVGAYPASNPSNLTTLAAVRSMTHTNQTWAAIGTNVVYELSWDVSNGTFRVLEILP
jgi:hypothetical protein